MVGLLMQPTTFCSSLSTKANVCSKQSGKTKRAVKMKCSLQSPPMRVRTFSGLQGVNALDNMVNRSQDFHSKVAVATSVRRGKASRIVPKATFKRFNVKVTKVIILAEEEARQFGQNFKCTEMILLGLIGEDTGTAAKVLKSMGINYENTYAEVEKIIGRGRGFVGEKILNTPLASRVFGLASEEARQLGHNYFGTEHLLLGLLRVGDCVAVRVLENLGVDPFNIRKEVMKMVGESGEVVGAGVGGRSSENKMLNLEDCDTNFTKLSEEGKLDPIFEWQPQIETDTQIPVGLTKTKPETIEGKKVITLDMGLRRELEGKLKNLIKLSDEINLFINEFHTLIGVREGSGILMLLKGVQNITNRKTNQENQ